MKLQPDEGPDKKIIEMQQRNKETSYYNSVKVEQNNQNEAEQRGLNSNPYILRDNRDQILQLAEQQIGESLRVDMNFLINKFYENCAYEEKRNSLIVIVYVLYFLKSHEMSNSIIRELRYFLKQSEDEYSGVATLNDIKLFIKNDKQVCGSLFKFLSIYKIGQLMKPFIKDLRLNLENVDKLTSSLLIQNNNLDAIDLMINYQTDTINQQELDKTKNVIFHILEKRYAEYKYLQSLSNLRQFSLISMFEIFFQSNFRNLWDGMLKYLKEYNQIEHGKIFVLAKKTVLDAIRFKRLDFIVKSLKYYRKETEVYLAEEDVFYQLLQMINETKYFSDIICILSQFYKQIKSRKQQEYLIEIFNMMLNNNCSIINGVSLNNNNNTITTSVYHGGGGNKSIYNSPKSLKNQNFQMCESQVYSQDLQKFNINLSYLLYTISPIITATIISKIFYVLSMRFHSPLKQKLLQVAKEYLNLAIGFSLELDDLRDWKLILFDIIYPARFTLIQITINYKEFFYPLLSLNNIKNTLFIKWKSEYDFSFNILACSSLWNIIQECYEQKRGRIKDMPPFSPLINGYEQQGYVQQNCSQYQSQSRIDDMNIQKNIVFNYTSSSKINDLQKRAMQQDIQDAIGSILEDQYSAEPQENGINQRLVDPSSAVASTTPQKPKNLTLQKVYYFLVDGIRLIKQGDISNEYYLYQKVVIEQSVMIRNILELVFYIILFIVCFVYSQAFIEKFTDFQKITDDYLTLSFQQIPPSKYLPVWESTCKQFQIDFQSSPRYSLEQLNITPNENNYKDLCKAQIWYLSCGIEEMQGLFQTDCQRLLLLIIIMDKLGVTPKVFFGLFNSLGLQLILLIFYQSLIKKRAYKFSFFDLIDVSITILASIIVWHMHVYLDPKAYDSELDQYDLKNNCAILKSLLMFFFLLLWIRFFRFVHKTEKLGKVVKMFELMVKDLGWFLIILFLALAAFSMFFYIGYGYTYDEYNSLIQTFLSLFSSVFGNFSLDGKMMDAQIYLIIFLIIFNIIVLNLLIAILSNTYSLVTHHGNMEYSLILNDDYKMLKRNDTYGSTYYFPPPLNVINIVLAPFIYLFPQQALLINQINFHISYFILTIVFTSVFIVLSLIMIAPSYITTFFQIIFNINHSFTLRTLPRIFLSLIWLTFGIPILLFYILLNDMPLFIKSCYFPLNTQNIQKIFEIDQYEKMNISFFKNILRKIRQQSKKKTLLSLSCFNASVYSHVQCQQNYQSIPNPSPNFTSNNGGLNNNNQQNTNNLATGFIKNEINSTQLGNADNMSQFFQGKSEQLITNGQNFTFYQKQLAKNQAQQSIQFKVQSNEKISKDPNINNLSQIPNSASENQIQLSQSPILGNSTNQPEDLSYIIKVTPAPQIDRENKIVDSVTTTIDDTLNEIKMLNQNNQFNMQEDLGKNAFTPQIKVNPANNIKQPTQQQDFPQSNIGKSKRIQQKSSVQETQFQYSNNKYEKNYNNLFIDTAQEDSQDYLQGILDEEGDLVPKRSNSQAFTPSIDIITSKKITEMYYQEVLEQQKQQKMQSPFNSNQKREEIPNYQVNYLPPTLGPNLGQNQQEKSSGLWLELFLKRTSFQANFLKYSMLLQFLLDARKSVDNNLTKYYREKKKLDKQSELISLIDVGMGKRALLKYFQNQQTTNSFEKYKND